MEEKKATRDRKVGIWLFNASMIASSPLVGRQLKTGRKKVPVFDLGLTQEHSWEFRPNTMPQACVRGIADVSMHLAISG